MANTKLKYFLKFDNQLQDGMLSKSELSQIAAFNFVMNEDEFNATVAEVTKSDDLNYDEFCKWIEISKKKFGDRPLKSKFKPVEITAGSVNIAELENLLEKLGEQLPGGEITNLLAFINPEGKSDVPSDEVVKKLFPNISE